MASERVTGFSGVPSTYAILCARTEFLRREWPDLRYLTQAGGAMSPALTRRILAALPERIQLFVMYGQTEASARLAYVPPERLPEKVGSIGVGIPGVDLTVQRADGSECDVDEVGELVARGDNIMQGYWNDRAATDLVLKDGALYTGDLGRRDTDGYIFIVDRVKNIIKAGANRVSAKEVEDTIAECEGVMEVCVVGVPDELLGEAIEAFVVPAAAGQLSEQTILAHLRNRLALYKLPRSIRFVDGLPKSSAGKIVKAELIKQVRR
jgi:acyl-CoA synthetase (AMP-forming)/AMP-acid ligase II